MTIAVLAGNRLQFIDYQKAHPEQKLFYCADWPSFGGIEFTGLVEIGTFRERKDALAIYQKVVPMIRGKI